MKTIKDIVIKKTKKVYEGFNKIKSFEFSHRLFDLKWSQNILRVFHKTLKQELSCSRQSSTVYKKRTVLWDPARRLVLREICTMRKVNEMACIAECHLIAVTETTLSFLRESRR